MHFYRQAITETEVGEQYASAGSKMLVEAALAAAAPAVIAAFLPWQPRLRILPLWGYVFIVSLLIAIALILRFRRVVVLVLEQEILYRRPGRKTIRIARAGHAFEPRVRRYAHNDIVWWTSRCLVVTGPNGSKDLDLPNFDGTTFNLLASVLRSGGSSSLPPTDAVFFPPRDKMLLEQAWLMLAMLLGVLAACAAVYGVVGYSCGWGMVGEMAGPIFLTGIFLCMFPLTFMAVEYVRKARRIPERLEFAEKDLLIDDASFPFSSLQWVKLTPPDSRGRPFAGGRTLEIMREGGSRTFSLGPREGRGFLRTVFEDYPNLCRKFEDFAAAKGFRLIYDL